MSGEKRKIVKREEWNREAKKLETRDGVGERNKNGLKAEEKN